MIYIYFSGYLRLILLYLRKLLIATKQQLIILQKCLSNFLVTRFCCDIFCVQAFFSFAGDRLLMIFLLVNQFFYCIPLINEFKLAK